jgi:hypothetical protein
MEDVFSSPSIFEDVLFRPRGYMMRHLTLKKKPRPVDSNYIPQVY